MGSHGSTDAQIEERYSELAMHTMSRMSESGMMLDRMYKQMLSTSEQGRKVLTRLLPCPGDAVSPMTCNTGWDQMGSAG